MGMTDRLRTCIHILWALKFRQVRNRWCKQDSSHYHAVQLLMPRFMYPNTRRTVDEDKVDAGVVTAILEAANKLHRLVDSHLYDDNQ